MLTNCYNLYFLFLIQLAVNRTCCQQPFRLHPNQPLNPKSYDSEWHHSKNIRNNLISTSINIWGTELTWLHRIVDIENMHQCKYGLGRCYELHITQTHTHTHTHLIPAHTHADTLFKDNLTEAHRILANKEPAKLIIKRRIPMGWNTHIHYDNKTSMWSHTRNQMQTLTSFHRHMWAGTARPLV